MNRKENRDKCHAVYYERVSTINPSQDESMENQRRLLESYCKRHPNVDVVAEFSERISGKSDERPQFQAMLSRVKEGDIDLILVKDLKRLSRSQEVSAELRNLAKDYRFEFVLLGTGQVYDPNASENRMLYGFESLINEEVVYRQSEYGRLAHRQKMEARRLNRNNVTFGYVWSYEKNDIDIEESEAVLIRQLFELYAFKDYGTLELRKYLALHGVFRTSATIRKWLSETAYVGVFHMNKKGSELGVGKGRHTRRYTNPVDEWVPVNRPDLAIVSQDLFDLVQDIKHYRASKYPPDVNGIKQGRFRGSHLFSSKIFCADCGCPYVHGYADRNHEIGIYRVARSQKAGDILSKCPNTSYHRVYEEDIINIIIKVIHSFSADESTIIDELIEVIRTVLNEAPNGTDTIQSLEKDISHLRRKQKVLRDKYLHSTGQLSIDLEKDYNSISETLSQKENEFHAFKNALNRKTEASGAIEKRVIDIKNTLRRNPVISENDLTREVISSMLKKITLHKNGILEVIIDSGRLKIEEETSHRSRNPKKGSSFCIRKKSTDNETSYSNHIKRIKEIYERIYTDEFPSTTQLYLFSFDYFSEKHSAGKKGASYNYTVIVFLNLKIE